MGNTRDKGNYRPIAFVTACSKLFEVILLELLEQYLDTCYKKFGFKLKHCTDLCVFTLKRVIHYF